MAAYPCLIPSKKGWELLAKKTPEEAKRQRMLLNEPNVMDDIRSGRIRSEEHTSELQSLMRISYAVFCLKKKKERTKKIDPELRQSTKKRTCGMHTTQAPYK